MNQDPTNREHLEAIVEYLRVNGGGFTEAYYVTMARLAKKQNYGEEAASIGRCEFPMDTSAVPQKRRTEQPDGAYQTKGKARAGDDPPASPPDPIHEIFKALRSA